MMLQVTILSASGCSRKAAYDEAAVEYAIEIEFLTTIATGKLPTLSFP